MKAIIDEDCIARERCQGESLPDSSERKVLRIRRQIKDGKYDLDERLEAVIERILEDVCK